MNISLKESVRIEIAKLQRSKVILFGLLLSASIVLFSCMNLFAAGVIDTFVADPEQQWAGLLIGFVMALGLISPLQLAMLANRAVDPEHLAGGWLLNAVAGVSPGTLVCRKFVLFATLVTVLKTIECALAMTLPVVLGAPAPSAAIRGDWICTMLGLIGTSVALLALMMWLSAWFESQLVVLGVGVLGGFLGVAALLSPPWLARINPFGYFAVLLPYGFSDAGVVPVTPQWLAWAVYLVVVCGLFAYATRALNAKEV